MTKIEILKNQNRLLSLTVIDALDIVMPKSKYVELTVNLMKNSKNRIYGEVEEMADELINHLVMRFGASEEKLKSLPFQELTQIYEMLDRLPIDLRLNIGKFIELNERGLINNKDVTSYKNIDDMLRQISLAELKMINKELEKQVHKVYEDDEWLVLRPLSRESSLKYGAGTKWCTASTTDDYQYWGYTGRGILIYTINKKTGQKVATFKNLSQDHDHELSFWNEVDTRIDSYEANLPKYISDSIFKELESTITNRAMSSEEDLRFKTKPMTTLLSEEPIPLEGGELVMQEGLVANANNTLTINRFHEVVTGTEMTLTTT